MVLLNTNLLRKYVSKIQCLWLIIIDIFNKWLWTPKAPVLSIILLVVSVIVSDQVPDLFLYYAHNAGEKLRFWIVAAGTLSLWSLVIYYCTYKLFYQRYMTFEESVETQQKLSITKIAHRYTLALPLVFLITGVNAGRSENSFVEILIPVLIVCLITSFLTWICYQNHQKLITRKSTFKPNQLSVKTGKWFAILWLITVVGVVAISQLISDIFQPTSQESFSWLFPSSTLGSFGVIFLFLAIFTLFFSGLNFASQKYKIPFTTLAIIWLITGSIISNDHAIILGNANTQFIPVVLPKEKKHLSDTFDAYQELKNKEASNQMPIYFVATAGGGIRAAYWTEKVLSKINCIEPKLQFSKNLFSISAVSGGSFGAATYSLDLNKYLVNNELDLQYEKDICTKLNDVNTFSSKLSTDYLSDVLAGFFFTETANRITAPFYWIMNKLIGYEPSPLLNRGSMLSQSWDNAWRSVQEKNTQEYFSEFYNSEREGPILLFNSTDALTGKRVILSEIPTKGISVDALDFSSIVKSNRGENPLQISLAEAVLNSARFTYVSPPGNYDPSEYTKEVAQTRKLQLVDGGYFENYGAETTFEIMQMILGNIKGKKIVVIQISNDGAAFAENHSNDLEPGNPKGSGLELGVPLKAILNTREARGILATKRLESFALSNEFMYYHFKFCPDTVAPLGWTISQPSRDRLNSLAEKQVNYFVQKVKEYIKTGNAKTEGYKCIK